MFSRKYRRMLVLSLVVSAGALALQPAEAAPSRNAALKAGSAVQAQLFTRSLLEAVQNLWGVLKDAPPGPPPGNDPRGPNNREGSGMCPIGNPHPGP